MAQLLTWMKAHLSPLYSWAAATSSGTVAKLPENCYPFFEVLVEGTLC